MYRLMLDRKGIREEDGGTIPELTAALHSVEVAEGCAAALRELGDDDPERWARAEEFKVRLPLAGSFLSHSQVYLLHLVHKNLTHHRGTGLPCVRSCDGVGMHVGGCGNGCVCLRWGGGQVHVANVRTSVARANRSIRGLAKSHAVEALQQLTKASTELEREVAQENHLPGQGPSKALAKLKAVGYCWISCLACPVENRCQWRLHLCATPDSPFVLGIV